MHERAHHELEQLCDVQAAHLLLRYSLSVRFVYLLRTVGPIIAQLRDLLPCMMRGFVARCSFCSWIRRPLLSIGLSLLLPWATLTLWLGGRRNAGRVRVGSA